MVGGLTFRMWVNRLIIGKLVFQSYLIMTSQNRRPKQPISMFFPKNCLPRYQIVSHCLSQPYGFYKKKKKKKKVTSLARFLFIAVHFSIKVIKSANICLYYSSLLVSKYDA